MMNTIKNLRKRLSVWLVAVLLIHLFQPLPVMHASTLADEPETHADTGVFSFGRNNYGQLGHGDVENQLVPKKIEGLSGIKAIASGLDHSLVLTDLGEVYSFGRGRDGRLGHGDTEDQRDPKKIDGLSGIQAIAAGHAHSLALTDSGEVYSFGGGGNGRLGHGDTENQLTPKKISVISDSDIRIQAIAAGQSHSLILTDSGEMYSFGWYSHGRLGHGNDFEDQLIPKKIVAFSDFDIRIQAIAAGHVHSLALTDSGQVYSFGFSDDGRLGHGDRVTQRVPKIIDGLSGIQAIAISSGLYHSLVLTKSGEVYSFGSSTGGRLGHGEDIRSDQLDPKKILFFSDSDIRIQAIAAGQSYSLALTDSGEVYSFGYGSNGQLGHGDTVNQLVPKKIDGLSGIQAIAAGGFHSMLFMQSGVPSEIRIRGASEVTIPASGELTITEQYEADVLDEKGEIMPGEAVQWSVTEAEGVSIEEETGLLTVKDQASAEAVTVRATLIDDADLYAEITVTLEAGEPEAPLASEIRISGASEVGIPSSDEPSITEEYKADVLDEEGEAMPYETVQWSVTEAEGVSIDAQTGVLTVTDQALAGMVTVRATLIDEAEIYAEIEVKLEAGEPEPPKPGSEAPQWPEGAELLVSDISQTSVKLSWPSALDQAGVTGYRINVEDDNWSLQTVSGNVYEYTVSGLRSGATYHFSVEAVNAVEKTSVPLHQQASTAQSAGGGPVLSGNADLAELQVWANGQELKLSPSFASGTTDYTAQTEAEQIEIGVKKAHSASKVTLGDKVLNDSFQVDLAEGENTFILTVQAENGTRKTYTLTLHREKLDLTDPEDDIPTEPAIEFADIDGHWAEADIKRAAMIGFISGYPDHTFKPNVLITRAEFAVMLSGALQWEDMGIAYPFADHDQIGAWAKGAVAQAVQAGIVRGYQDGQFRPNAPITRSEMAVMIARALKLQTNASTTGFADEEAIPQWAKGEVEAVRNVGIVAGRGGNQFVPNGPATRAEAAVMLLRMLEANQ